MPGVDCGSDPVTVIASMKVKLKILTNARRFLMANINFLRSDEDLKSKFAISVLNQLDSLDRLTSEERWERTKECIHETTELVLEITRKEHKKCMTQDILNLMEAWIKANNDATKYALLDRMIKKVQQS